MEHLWDSFRLDPRLPAHTHLRASDADRDLIRGVLTDAYADGRLDREEYDARAATLLDARTLGELPPLVSDLIASEPVPDRPPALLAAADLRARGVAAWRKEVGEAVAGFLVPSLICIVIWVLTGADYFFWPAFVLLLSGINLIQTVARRESIIERESRRLTRKAEKRRERELEGRVRGEERGEEPERDEEDT